MITYRKLKDGSWGVFGPVSELNVGKVTVTKKDGSSKDETVLNLSRAFDADGVPCAYGFLEPPKAQQGGTKIQTCPYCKGKMFPSKYGQGKFYCPKKECRDKKEEAAVRKNGRCENCGSPWCDGASGGLCEQD